MTFKAHAQGVAKRPRSADKAPRHPRSAGTPRFLQPTVARPAASIPLGRPGDAFEREADRVADTVRQDAPVARPPAIARPAAAPPAVPALQGGGRPLDGAMRASMEPRLRTDLGHVRMHTGAEAASLNRDLGSRAFTLGSDIFFGAGHGPHDESLLAHELTHAVQQGGGVSGQGISGRSGPPVIQRSLISSMSLPLGGFEMGMQSFNGAGNTPPTFSGLSGTIRFIPDVNAPNANSISLVQIVRLTDLGGIDQDPQSMGAPQAPRGALGDPGVRTQDDQARGVEGGFFTDALHKPLAAGAPPASPGSLLSPNYPFRPLPTGGGSPPQVPGFKRSSDPADIRSASLFDSPGATGAGANFSFKFETAARSEDTGIVYGALNWGFRLHAGVVEGEFLNPQASQSATFDEALERHRDFYVHEPVSFYFDFDSDVLNAGEGAKIDEFMTYLSRNSAVQVSLEGFADQVGGASAYNADLSLRRAAAVHAALLARGISASRIDSIIIGHGASSSATTDAGTGDQGGNPVVGADQSRESNRQMNRRVLLTFSDSSPPAPASTTLSPPSATP
jgi:outer membrane protein OmpA-like peptidoglycan-associated protein